MSQTFKNHSTNPGLAQWIASLRVLGPIAAVAVLAFCLEADRHVYAAICGR